VPAPVENIADFASDSEIIQIEHALSYSAVGSTETVKLKLQGILEETRPDELMIAGHFYDHHARLHSYELASQMLKRF
jgi:alkanesulfonate monooxygenase SsuD/methylene tetrahydromethanopterin reductase-like flavin-dependent oxidoreductase (luciferase family)